MMAVVLALVLGCSHSGGRDSANSKTAKGKSDEGTTAGIKVIRAERRDIRMTVLQPGTIQAYEVAPIYSRIAGYVQNYHYNIGDRVKAGDVLLDMWVPDLVELVAQKNAVVKRSEVQIRVVQIRLACRRGQGGNRPARILSAEAGVKAARRPVVTAGIRNTSDW